MSGEGAVLATRDAEADGNGNGSAPVESPAPSTTRGFFVVGAVAYLVTVAGMVAVGLGVTGGRLVYAIDDAAIHLSVAQRLAENGTWGVEAGHFESASSSPLWTVLLAAWIKLLPGPITVVPLILNAVAALVVLAVLAANQTVLRPARDRPWDVAAVAVLGSVLLFLPGLAFTGMEHTLHAALVLSAVVLFHRQVTGRPATGRWGAPWLPYLLLGLATLARFESAFVAAAMALWFLTAASDQRLLSVERLRRPFLVLAASGAPLAAFGLFNLAMGGALLPNSVLAKAKVGSGDERTLVEAVLGRFTGDPLVAVLTGLLLAALIVAGRRRSWGFPAFVTVVSVALHMTFARIGWYDRYQGYLVVLAAYAALCLATELRPAGSAGSTAGAPTGAPAGSAARPVARSAIAVPLLVLAALLFSGNKPMATFNSSDAFGETYEQRYQAAQFLARYYDGEPIATSELGYISLAHDGPITDIYGLGDYEVLRAWNDTNGRPPADYWERLADERGFEVAAVYPTTLWDDAPDSWVLVGTWEANQLITTAPGPDFQFYATSPEAATRLLANLEDYEDELPDRVTSDLNRGLAPGPTGGVPDPEGLSEEDLANLAELSEQLSDEQLDDLREREAEGP